MTGAGAGPVFASLVDEMAAAPGVTVPDPSGPRRFGSSALKVGGSIFAMLVNDSIVVKLAASRVDELVASGVGAPFVDGRGRPMKQWLTVTSDDPATCRALASEALAFVGGRPG